MNVPVVVLSFPETYYSCDFAVLHYLTNIFVIIYFCITSVATNGLPKPLFPITIDIMAIFIATSLQIFFSGIPCLAQIPTSTITKIFIAAPIQQEKNLKYPVCISKFTNKLIHDLNYAKMLSVKNDIRRCFTYLI